jgi:hypothetical protein
MSDETNEVLRIIQAEQDKIRIRLHTLISETSAHNLALETKIIKLEDKMEIRKPCDLHVSSMKELNDSVNEIKLSSNKVEAKVDGFMLAVNRFLDRIENDVYKDGGLMTKASSNKNQIALQWGFIGLLCASEIALFFWRMK